MMFEIKTQEQIQRDQLARTNQSIKTIESWTESLKKLRKKKQKLVTLWKIFKWSFIITALLGFAALIKLAIGVLI